MVDYSAIEQQYGLPQGYLTRVRQIESGGGKNVFNAQSNAAGDFQFIPRTAQAYSLKDPYDPAASADAAARLAVDNRFALQRGGVADPTGAHLYLAHQQGAGGALKLINSEDPSGGLVGRNAVSWNGGDPSIAGSSFANKIMAKYDGTTPQTGGTMGGSEWSSAPSTLPTPEGWGARAGQTDAPIGNIPARGLLDEQPAFNAVQPYAPATPLSAPLEGSPAAEAAATPGLDGDKLAAIGAKLLDASKPKEAPKVPMLPASVHRPSATALPTVGVSPLLKLASGQKSNPLAGLLGGF